MRRKKRKSEKISTRPLIREQTSSTTMVLQMASEELSPMATKKRTLRQAVEQVRQQQAQESLSPKERIIGALQEASSQNKSPFLTKRLSTRATEQLTSQEIQDLRLVFDVFDADKSGYIETDELRKALKVLGFRVKRDEVKKMIADIDDDNSGRIDFSEFVEYVISRQGDGRDIYSEIMQGFKIFDHDSSGKISIDNLKWAVKETGVSLTEQDLKDMIDEADTDGDNEIDPDEFMAVMLKTNLFL